MKDGKFYQYHNGDDEKLRLFIVVFIIGLVFIAVFIVGRRGGTQSLRRT